MPYKNREDRLAHCKTYNKKHYAENKEYYRQKKQRRRDEISDFIRSIKENLRCERCGEEHIACLEFHHNDPSRKEITIGDIRRYGWKKSRIVKEIEKCTVLCSNCHKKEHWDEDPR
jgi:hypothetical protein